MAATVPLRLARPQERRKPALRLAIIPGGLPLASCARRRSGRSAVACDWPIG